MPLSADNESDLTRANTHALGTQSRTATRRARTSSRTRGPAPMMMKILNNEASDHDVATNLLKAKMENCTVWKSETARTFLPNPDTIRLKATPKEEERAAPTNNVFAVSVS